MRNASVYSFVAEIGPQIKNEMAFQSFVDGRAIEGPISILDEDACQRINFKVDASTGDVQFSEG